MSRRRRTAAFTEPHRPELFDRVLPVERLRSHDMPRLTCCRALDPISFEEAVGDDMKCGESECSDVFAGRGLRGQKCFSCSHQGLDTWWLVQKRGAYLIQIDQHYLD